MKIKFSICVATLCFSNAILASDAQPTFTDEELSVAQFWADMGPVLRDEGLEAYAERYHENFRHWSIGANDRISNKASAIRAWTNYHENGHRITCTYVEPITIDIAGDTAVARLIYEQTDTYADGRTSTSVWSMVDVFKRYANSWQVLESNMLDVTPKDGAKDDSYRAHCPNESNATGS